MDIKNADYDYAEIGYWADAQNSGFMTNALHELIVLAKEKGYKKLFAKVIQDNEKSAGVLTRSGFARKEDKQEGDRHYLVFEKEL